MHKPRKGLLGTRETAQTKDKDMGKTAPFGEFKWSKESKER